MQYSEGKEAAAMPDGSLLKKGSSVQVSIDPQLSQALAGEAAAVPVPVSTEARPDYILIYRVPLQPEKLDAEERVELEEAAAIRQLFLDEVVKCGITISTQETTNDEHKRVHVFLTASTELLLDQAEKMHLEMPVKGLVEPPPKKSLWGTILDFFRVDNEVDIIGSPYTRAHHDIFVGSENPESMFRSSLRQMLLFDTITRINLYGKHPTLHHADSEAQPAADDHHRYGGKLLRRLSAEQDAHTESGQQQCNNFVGLRYLLHNNVFKDSLAPHEPLADDRQSDSRSRIAAGYRKWLHFQPMWSLRNYYGEELALFFAWTGALAYTLIPLVVFGLIAFLYGAANLNRQRSGLTSTEKLSATFDNSITPWFAFAICLWSSVFLETWKRRQAVLAFEWDVADFEEEEPHRPQFIGTKQRPNAITGLPELFYPFAQRLRKLAVSYALSLSIIALVIISAVAIITYRVVAAAAGFFSSSSDPAFAITVTSSILNALSISLFGALYNRLAVILTEWENHRTQSQFNRHLIIKLFAFQFVNSYTSLFYIAFFRRGIPIFGRDDWRDSCGADGNCMSMLSIQVLVMLSVKPVTKMCTDNIVPWLRRCLKRTHTAPDASWLERELNKAPMEDQSKDFIINDYLDRVIQYGYLTMFATAFPLAPLLVVIVIMIDVRTDIQRYLFRSRRPIARRAESIGVWHTILEFINAIAVVSNGFLIAFTSQYGRDFADEHGSYSNLWLLVAFEHAVVAIKFIIAYVIPDVPHSLILANRRKVFRVAQMIDESKERQLTRKLSVRQPRKSGGNVLSTMAQQAHRSPPALSEEDEDTGLASQGMGASTA